MPFLPPLAGNAAQDAAVIRQGLVNSETQALPPSDLDYRRAILMADKYRPISGKAGMNEELVAGPLLFGLCATGLQRQIAGCWKGWTSSLGRAHIARA